MRNSGSFSQLEHPSQFSIFIAVPVRSSNSSNRKEYCVCALLHSAGENRTHFSISVAKSGRDGWEWGRQIGFREITVILKTNYAQVKKERKKKNRKERGYLAQWLRLVAPGSMGLTV